MPEKEKIEIDESLKATRGQLRHAQSMARKMLVPSERIVNYLTYLADTSIDDLEGALLLNLYRRFEHDSGGGILDHVDHLLRILADMLDDLPKQ